MEDEIITTAYIESENLLLFLKTLLFPSVTYILHLTVLAEHFSVWMSQL
jgi:hypothetical protein